MDKHIHKMVNNQWIQLNELRVFTDSIINEINRRNPEPPIDPNYPIYTDWDSSIFEKITTFSIVPLIRSGDSYVNAKWSNIYNSQIVHNYDSDSLYIAFGTMQSNTQINNNNFSSAFRERGEMLPVNGIYGAISMKYLKSIYKNGHSDIEILGNKIALFFEIYDERGVISFDLDYSISPYVQGMTPYRTSDIDYSSNNTFTFPRKANSFIMGNQYDIPLFMIVFNKR